MYVHEGQNDALHCGAAGGRLRAAAGAGDPGEGLVAGAGDRGGAGGVSSDDPAGRYPRAAGTLVHLSADLFRPLCGKAVAAGSGAFGRRGGDGAEGPAV